MQNRKTTRISSIVAPLFFAAMLLSGCGGADETGFEDELDDETAETDDSLGEAESEMIRGGSTGGADFCGWFCPVWAKDLSDCLMIPCDD